MEKAVGLQPLHMISGKTILRWLFHCFLWRSRQHLTKLHHYPRQHAQLRFYTQLLGSKFILFEHYQR